MRISKGLVVVAISSAILMSGCAMTGVQQRALANTVASKVAGGSVGSTVATKNALARRTVANNIASKIANR